MLSMLPLVATPVNSVVTVIAVLVILVAIIAIANIKVVPQAHAYVIERLGAYQSTWGTGLHFKSRSSTKSSAKCP